MNILVDTPNATSGQDQLHATYPLRPLHIFWASARDFGTCRMCAKTSINAHADLSGEHLSEPYFVFASSEGSGESVHILA